MQSIQKARLGTYIMYGGFVLMLLLTWLFGRHIPMIGILGIFTALGGYGLAAATAKCPECGCQWLDGPAGFPLLFQLPLGQDIVCRECGHTVRAGEDAAANS